MPAREHGAVRALVAVSITFGLYAAFMWCEAVDMAALLHSPQPGIWTTYGAEHLPFYGLEAGLCAAFALVPLALRGWVDAGRSLAVVLGAMLLFRLMSVEWLYFSQGAPGVTVPSIYKKAFPISRPMRMLFVPAQLAVLAWAGWRFARADATQRSP